MIILFFILQLLLYRYNLGLFYYTLGNISPKHRSSLDAIQLVSVVKHSIIVDYGIDKILEPFIEDIKALESVCKYMYMHVHVLSTFHCTCIVFYRMMVLILKFKEG